jgi:DNA recombination protein RmuC
MAAMLWLATLIFVSAIIVLAILTFKIYGRLQDQLSKVNQDVQNNLKEVVQTLQQTGQVVGQRLEVFGDVKEGIGRLEAATKNMIDIAKDISNLQELLRPPQPKGKIGETILGNMLLEVFGDHKEFYEFQYQFKNGSTVDAVIRIGKNLVPIDAKFPIESFRRILEAKDEKEKDTFKREFSQTIRKKIDDISSKYILPDEGTFNFVLMYIPAEAIYYQIIKDDSIFSYSLSKKVIPVSPNSFFPYLQVICQGLKGLVVERNAQRILANLARLKGELDRFKGDFEILGRHIFNARQKFDDAERRLGRFEEKLLDVQPEKPQQIETKEEMQ